MKISKRLRYLLSVSVLGSIALVGQTVQGDDFIAQEITASDPGTKILDPEFDALLARFCWIDEGVPLTQGDETLWVGGIDPRTGVFDPLDGRKVQVDQGNIVSVQDAGNGCEWVFSDTAAQIVYTKTLGTLAKDRVVARAAFANDAWLAGPLDNSTATFSPIGSLDRGDPTPYISYQGFVSPEIQGDQRRALYVRKLGDATSERMLPLTDWLFTPGARWVPGADSAIYTRPMPPAMNLPRQVFLYDAKMAKAYQLTSSDTIKHSALMWQAPEYQGEPIFFALENETYIGIYRNIVGTNGKKIWTRVITIDPPAIGPYIWSPEVFVVGDKSYISMTTSTSKSQSSLEIPTEVWIAGIDPNAPFYRKISDERELVRKDPEPVILGGDLPVELEGDTADYTLTESLTVAPTGTLMAIGSSADAPAGGRNGVFVFELPVLQGGQVISKATFAVQVLNTFVFGSLGADLWALSIEGPGAQPLTYLEANVDADVNHVKIADNLLTKNVASSTRAKLSDSQAATLADYLMDFYAVNPGYTGGSYLYLRLNQDMDNGTNNVGWSLASSDNTTEAGPTLTLNMSEVKDVQDSPLDYALTEDLQIVQDNQLLPIGSVAGEAADTEGRNAILMFELPILDTNSVVSRASVTFSVGGNSATPGLTGDLWALAVGPVGQLKDFNEVNIDPSPGRKKVADNILTDGTPLNQPITTSVAQGEVLADFLMNFYRNNLDYSGGYYAYLRVNPDTDTGSIDAGWYIYSAENSELAAPLMRMTVQAQDKVWVYSSVGGEMHRLETGLGAPAE